MLFLVGLFNYVSMRGLILAVAPPVIKGAEVLPDSNLAEFYVSKVARTPPPYSFSFSFLSFSFSAASSFSFYFYLNHSIIFLAALLAMKNSSIPISLESPV